MVVETWDDATDLYFTLGRQGLYLQHHICWTPLLRLSIGALPVQLAAPPAMVTLRYLLFVHLDSIFLPSANFALCFDLISHFDAFWETILTAALTIARCLSALF